ncbi:MAG: patatin-like phospholipase family protein [Rudanella sp.]|nr:patatin-like phospholipase family protein [Rudanella sp.]
MLRRAQHIVLSIQYFLIYSWAVLRHVLMHVLMLLVGYLILTGGPQVDDIFRSLNASEPNIFTNRHFRVASLYTVLWGLSIWFCGRILLTLADVRGPKLLDSFRRFPQQESERERERLTVYIQRIPRLLGIMPPVLLALACLNAENTNPFYVFWFLLLGLGMGLWFMFHRFVLRKLFPAIRFDPHLYFPDRRHWHTVWITSNATTRLIYAFLIGNWLLWLFFIFVPADWMIYRKLGPLGVILTGFVWFTPFVSLLSFWNSPTRPVLLLTLLWIVFCSFFNDHTLLRFSDSSPSKIVDARPGVASHFEQWLGVRPSWPTDTMPVFIVATEGGGIRSLNWTAGVLHKLDSIFPAFRNQTFAISGVSGGGAGAALYAALQYDIRADQKGASLVSPVRFSSETQPGINGFRQAFGDDFLSPLLGPLFFHETLQRMVPFAVQQLNRSNWLEDAWSLSYRQRLHRNTLEQPFLTLFQADPLRTPSLFLNSVLTESGQKAILSNLRIDNEFFHDVIDIYDITRRDLPIKTAASVTARFPWLTGGGLLTRPNGRAFGHVVDGGYWDNTGLETAMSVLASIAPVIEQLNRRPNAPFQVVPVVLYLQNSMLDDAVRVSNTFIDVSMPIEASMNANERKSAYVASLTRNTLRNYTPRTRFYQISLDRQTGIPLPLGWYLSDDAQHDLWRKIDALPQDQAGVLRTLSQYF